MKNGKGKRDEHIRELRELGLSLRAIGRRVGLSRMQVSRILDSLATGDPAEVVSVTPNSA
jgi:transcriptional regulator with XRE-family HTH domain